MSSLPPSEPQPPIFGDPESQARSHANEERNAAAQEPQPYVPSGPQYAPYQPPKRQRRSRWYVWAIGGCLALLGVTILACAVLGGIFAGFLIHVANETPVSETSTQSFSVTGAPSLDIQGAMGKVDVIQDAVGRVSLEVTKSVRAATNDEARSDLNGIHVNVTQTGDTIKIVSTFDQGSGLGRQPRVDLRLSVPPTTNVSIQATTGEVALYDITGLFNINVVAGDLQTDAVTLANGSQLHVTSGSLRVNGAVAAGASLDASVDTGQATLELPASTVAHLNARTNIGGIEISGWSVGVSKANLGASAVGDLGNDPLGTITVQVQTGNITISQT